jgi:beta-phosphoglucomutase-like phosphatase (HAD superfamily)
MTWASGRSIHTDCLNKKGLIEIFRYLEANGYRTGICSSSPKEYILGLLDTVSVPLHYDAMITGDMVRHTKPDPEIFLTCARLLKTEPAQCLVLEDSKQGIAAAHNAGMHSCWIYDTIAADDEMKRLLEFKEDSLLDVIPLLEKQAAR